MDSVSVLCGGIEEHDLDVLLPRCEKHTVAVNSAELGRLEVGDENYLLADEIIGLIELCNSGNDLALLIAEVDLKLEKLLCLGNGLAGDDLCNAELNCRECVDADLCLVLGLLYGSSGG